MPHIRALLKEEDPKADPKITVVVASKRHHIRFFPDRGIGADRNANPVPGTIVERDVTSPFDWDWYLCAHSAIQGTARPVHYQVLMDEIKVGSNQIQNWIYECSYQYMRSTTPVSLFPAIYYAHLAADRGRAHENTPASSGPTSGPGFKPQTQEKPITKTAGTASESTKSDTEYQDLLAIGQGARFEMWYI